MRLVYIFFMALLVASVDAQLYYELHVERGIIQDVYVLELDFVPEASPGPVEVTVFSHGDTILWRANVTEDGKAYLPFYEDGNVMEFSYGEDKSYYDVGFYSSSCGDGFCQEYENYYSCRIDCMSGRSDSYCDKLNDGRCDPDCSVTLDPDCASSGKCNFNKICEPDETKVSCPEDCLSGSYCYILKDGVCDPDCPQMDIDCLCGDGICQPYENTQNCEQDCFNTTLTVQEEITQPPYQVIIPLLILASAILLFIINEYRLRNT